VNKTVTVLAQQLATPRYGWLDLVLVISVCLPVWTRTPVGGLAAAGAQRMFGGEAREESLTSYFQTGAPAEVGDWAVEVAESMSKTPVQPEEQGGPGGPPRLSLRERLAVQRVFAERLPDNVSAAIAPYSSLPEGDRVVALLEEVLAGPGEGDLEKALELVVLGAEAVERAVDRATAAGVAEPQRLAGHRRFFSADEARLADTFVSGVMALATALDLAWPLDLHARISSPFGDRVHPVLKTHKLHNGVDLAVPIGTPVHAAQAGRVITAAENSASGNYVILDHGNGVRTAYCHLSQVEVVKGDQVVRGQEVARSGNTGRSTGPHLHYITRLGGRPVDPLRLHRTHP